MKKYLLTLLIATISNNTQPINICGYKLVSPIGVAACPLTTSNANIKKLASLGYDVITYKTIRSSYHPIISPHIYPVDINRQLAKDDLYATFHIAAEQTGDTAITNSFGINSDDRETTIQGIAQARALLSSEQILIVSVYGSGNNRQEQIDDFVATAHIATLGGAHIIEANLSCPNINNNEYIYKDPALVHDICKAITTATPDIPLIIKVGVFDTLEQTRAVILAAHAAGASGICGINSIPAYITDAQNNPIYGPDHRISGISGAPLLNMTRAFVKDVRAIIDQEHLSMAILATGGVTRPEDFDTLLAAGADVALSATGVMMNKQLAQEYHALHRTPCSIEKRELIKNLYAIGAIKIGSFTLKSGRTSPFYIDMRLAISYPQLLHALAKQMSSLAKQCECDLICGIPQGAVPIATLVSSLTHIPMIMVRKEVKSYGTQKMIEGVYKDDNRCLLIEDVITSGMSILEIIDIVERHHIHVKDIMVLIDREQGGVQHVQAKRCTVHALFTLSELLHVLLEDNIIDHKQCAAIKHFCAHNRT